MVRFYNLSFNEVDDLEMGEFTELWEAITVIEAQEVLLQLKIQDWPNMKNEDRSKFHKQMYKSAYPRFEENKNIKPMTSKDLARLLGGA